MPGRKGGVTECLLHDPLRVVESARNRNGKNITRAGTGHLALLQWRNPAFRIQNENRDALVAHAAMNGCAAGVPGGGAEDGESFAAALRLSLVEQPQELQSKVL